VKLRYLAGLTVNEAARLLGISPATADRHWTCARAWLFRELAPEEDCQAGDGLPNFLAPQ
jgi:DNA-directed RNA polymerase specialized sigma24 family protein